MSWSKGLVQVFMLRCAEASELSSREMDERLGTLERVALYAHLIACGSCRRFRRQLQVIRAAIRLRATLPESDGQDEGALSEEARHRIVDAIRQATQDGADGLR